MYKQMQAAGLAVAVLLALQLGGCSAQQREATYRQRGARYLADHNLEKARVELNNALQINPKDAKARYLAGVVAEKLGNPRDALGHFQAAVDADPAAAEARAGLARIYLFAGMQSKAMEQVQTGLKLTPDEPHLVTVRGAIYAQQGDRGAALRDAERAQSLLPEDELAVALLSSLYRHDGADDKAIGVVDRALERAPDNVDLRYILVDILQKAGRPADAEAQLRRIVGIQPKVLAHRIRLTQFLMARHDGAAAEKALREAIVAIPDSDAAKLSLVQLLAQQHDAATAQQQLQNFLAAEPNNDDLRLSFAQYYEASGNASEAEKLYTEVVAHASTKPEGLTARVRLAERRLAGKDSAGAAKLVDDVLKSSPRQPDALLLHAELAIERSDAPTAVTDLRAILRDQPNNVRVMRALARAHQLNNETSLAEEALRSAQEVDPKDATTGLQLAQLLVADGRRADALSVVQQLAKDQPQNAAVLEQLFRLQLVGKDYQAAQTTVANLQQTQPKLAIGYYLAGLLDEAQGHADAALGDYARAIELQPNVIEPLTAAVRLDVAAKKPERALARLDALIANNPQQVVAKNLKAEVLASLKRYGEAVALYDDVLKQVPGWSVPYHGLAIAQVLLEQQDAAVATLKRGLEATHGAPELTADLAALYESRNHADDAIQVYDDLLKRDPKSLLAMNNLATLLASYRGDKASLDRAAQLVASLGGLSDPRVLDTRGWVAFRTGAYEKAVPLLQQALAKLPDSALLHYRLGMAQLKTGDTVSARHNLELALKSGQAFLGAEEARATLASLPHIG
jgi:tetratricopeptide (TPR) repeat protein